VDVKYGFAEWIKKAERYASRKGLDLGLIHASVSVDSIEPRERHSEKKVLQVQEMMTKHGRWPKGLSPVFLVCDRLGSECMVLDGHHRIEAAKRSGLERVLAIVASWETFDALRDKYFDIASWDYMDVDRFISLLGILNNETDPVVQGWIKHARMMN
jgi:hypothetical protein